MEIKLNQPPFRIDPSVSGNKLDESDIHIVTTALKKSGFCISFLSRKGVSITHIANWCDMINSKDEAGTFSSNRITIIPLKPADKNQEVAISKYMDDVIKAHEEYYLPVMVRGKKEGCSTVEFIFDKDSGYNFDTLQIQIEQYLNQKSSEKSWIRNLKFDFSIY